MYLEFAIKSAPRKKPQSKTTAANELTKATVQLCKQVFVSSTEIGLIPVTTRPNFHYPTTCSEGCPPKRGHILIFFGPENGTNRQILLKRKFPALVSSTLKSPKFPDLACGLGSAHKQIKDKLIINTGQNGM
jgi:hypothetical protein